MITYYAPITGGTKEVKYKIIECEGTVNLTLLIDYGEVTPTTPWVHVTSSQTYHTITVTVDPSLTNAERSATIIPTINGSACTQNNIDITQASCNCNGITVNIGTIPSTGCSIGYTAGTYTVSDDCANLISITSDTINISAQNGNIIVNEAIGANTGPSVKTYNVYVLLNGQRCEQHTYVLRQPIEYSCSCENASVSLEVIPSTGYAANATVGSIELSEGCSVDTDSFILKNASTNQTYSCYISGRNIKLNNAIPENEDTAIIQFTASYNVNGDVCNAKTVQESAEIKCSCEYIDSFITNVRTTYSLNGSDGQRVLIASADTKGCGSITFYGSSPDMFEGGEAVTETIGVNQYAVYAIIKSGDAAIADINFKFLNNDGEEYIGEGCNKVITVFRSAWSFTCDNVVYVSTFKDCLQLYNAYLSPIYLLGSYNGYGNYPLNLKITNSNFTRGNDCQNFIKNAIKATFTISGNGFNKTFETNSNFTLKYSAYDNSYNVNLDSFGQETIDNVIPDIMCGSAITADVKVYANGVECTGETKVINQIGLTNDCCDAFKAAIKYSHSEYLKFKWDYEENFCTEICSEGPISVKCRTDSNNQIDPNENIEFYQPNLHIYDPNNRYSILMNCSGPVYELKQVTIDGTNVISQSTLTTISESTSHSDGPYNDVYFNGFRLKIPANTTSDERHVEGYVEAKFNGSKCVTFNFDLWQKGVEGVDPYDYTDCDIVSGMIKEDKNYNADWCDDLGLEFINFCGSNASGPILYITNAYLYTETGRNSWSYPTQYAKYFNLTFNETDQDGNVIENSTVDIKKLSVDSDGIDVQIQALNGAPFCDAHPNPEVSAITCGDCTATVHKYKIYYKLTSIENQVNGVTTICHPNYPVLYADYYVVLKKECSYMFVCNDSPLNYTMNEQTIEIPKIELEMGSTIDCGEAQMRKRKDDYVNHFEIEAKVQSETQDSYISGVYLEQISSTTTNFDRFKIKAVLNSDSAPSLVQDISIKLNINLYLVNNDDPNDKTSCDGQFQWSTLLLKA